MTELYSCAKAALRSLQRTSLMQAAIFSFVAAIVVTGNVASIYGEEAPGKSLPTGTAIPSIEASNTLELRGRVGQTIVVVGDVARVGKSAGGNRFINFAGQSELTIFISSDDASKFSPKSPEELYESGRTIAVTGKLERFRDKLQIQVRTPGQIGLAEKKPTISKADERLPETVTLTPIGRDSWISPTGLKYSGHDPEGRTRRDHVLRHARDFPDRDGPHGVFDGGDDITFGWIDLAWMKVKEQKIKPDIEGSRETYTVPMGQRVGFLGGNAGARRNHPALYKVFIVVRKGTTEVITAFPK